MLNTRSVRLEWDPPRANLSKALIYEIVLQNRSWKEKIKSSHTVKLAAVVENLHPGIPYYAYGGCALLNVMHFLLHVSHAWTWNCKLLFVLILF